MMPFTVELADGRKVEINQQINITELKLDTYHTANVKAQIIHLERYDVILGKPWLYHANPQIDWHTNIMTFQYGKKTIIVKADAAKPTHPSCNSVFISRQQLATIPQNAELFAICNTTMMANEDDEKKQKTLPEAQNILDEFSDIFPDILPSELLPRRAVDHAIDIIPGSELPSRPTYRLSQFEMAELKRQLADLTEKGFI